MTVTLADFVAITGLRVRGEPIPFDSGIQNDQVALEWFLGDAPKIEEGMAKYEQFTKYLKKKINWNPWSVAGAEPEYLARSRAISASRVLLESAFGWQWYLADRVLRQSLGYTAFQVPGPLPPRASHTSTYTRAEVERFMQPDTKLRRYLLPEMDYATYQRDRLAGPLGIRAFRDVRSQACGAAEERRAAKERSRGGEGRVRVHAGVPVRGGPPEMSWIVPVVDAQGNPAAIHLVPARVEPPPVIVPVPNEWVNEAIRRMLALENMAQGRATSRSKRARSPPQKKLAARTPVPPVASHRQTRSSQPVAANKEVAGQAVARAGEQFRIAMRKRQLQRSSEPKRSPSWFCFRPPRMKRKMMEKRKKTRKRETRRKNTHSPAAIPMIQLMIRRTRMIPRRELTTMTIVLTMVS
ncbi:hypothetical protein RHMOL_Rhmol04G0216800 [Rhododendron molle]|uniref:Uncharacterized protein n=1 Tax=Rhododendron molle TaxID=49168 RepID=A0ACC0P476_RHOML|nr:hypothetical protein RHMOL_Rhmol04G0216800 [Rhododendron molle]